MKIKMISRIVSAVTAAVLCVGMISGMMLSSFAEETSAYASTDYANKSELFDALMTEQGSNATITFPAPEGYVEGVTERVKFIVNGKLIGEKYSDKTFVMPFCGVDLTFDGSFLSHIGGERIEIQIQKKEPITVQYTCPKCATTEKTDAEGNGTGSYYKPYEGALDKYTLIEGDKYACPRCKSEFALSECAEPKHMEVVPGGLTIIEADKHAVVGAYVFDLDIYSDNKAISEFTDPNGGGISATIKLGAEALNAAKTENSKVSFNVYAYLSQQETYDNMNAKVDEANGTATFDIQDRGWFYLAGDDPSDVTLSNAQLLAKWLPVIIIAVVVVAAGIVVLVLVLKKGKKAPAAE